MKGNVKWFNNRKGFGFITGADGQDYFVHYTAIQKDGYKSLRENQEVTFDSKQEEKGMSAINVALA